MDGSDSGFDLYIVHAQEDLEWAQSLRDRLRTDGFIAELEDFLPGDVVLERVQDLISRSTCCLVVYSRASIAKYGEFKLRVAPLLGRGGRFIPAIRDRDVKLSAFAEARTPIDFSGRDDEAAYRQLIRVLRHQRDGGVAVTEPVVRRLSKSVVLAIGVIFFVLATTAWTVMAHLSSGISPISSPTWPATPSSSVSSDSISTPSGTTPSTPSSTTPGPLSSTTTRPSHSLASQPGPTSAPTSVSPQNPQVKVASSPKPVVCSGMPTTLSAPAQTGTTFDIKIKVRCPAPTGRQYVTVVELHDVGEHHTNLFFAKFETFTTGDQIFISNLSSNTSSIGSPRWYYVVSATPDAIAALQKSSGVYQMPSGVQRASEPVKSTRTH